MPYGKKTDATGRNIDFDEVYERVLAPAIESADMEPIRADEERDGGLIHKALFERLLLCDFALADLTLASANVFYELGVRHAARPHTTVLVFERENQRLPFDVAPLRATPYEVDASGNVVEAEAFMEAVARNLAAARDPVDDSPLYQLLEGLAPLDIARLKTDVFRDRARYSIDVKRRLAVARGVGADAVDSVRAELEPLANQEAGTLVDLYLSYRDTGSYEQMLSVAGEMPEPIRRSVLVQEQSALALNRLGRRAEAQSILKGVIEQQGPSSETLGLLGRIYKDRWAEALAQGKDLEATAHLRRAIDSYRRGFESDFRDAYPGINALTLLDIQGGAEAELNRLLPVVRYAVERRISPGSGDYWDHASLLELSVLGDDRDGAETQLGECLALTPFQWQRDSTAGNLKLIRDARNSRGSDVAWIDDLIAELLG